MDQESIWPYRKEIRPIWRLADETLVQRQQFVLEVEQLLAHRVGEDLPTGDGHDFALAFADFAPADIGDAEVVAREGAAHDAFLLHLQRNRLGLAELWEDADGRVEWL